MIRLADNYRTDIGPKGKTKGGWDDSESDDDDRKSAGKAKGKAKAKSSPGGG